MADETSEKHPLDVYVFDRRKGDEPENKINVAEIPQFQSFVTKIREVFHIGEHEEFVVVTTERIVIDDETYIRCLSDGDTLYLLNTSDQDLSAPVRERVDYLPHYDTLTKSGMYEYYASEGQNPLAFAFAELIDNALYATSTNTGSRNIEIRLMFDDTNRNSVCILDNGTGMNSKELNDWAVYRLSKHNRSQRRSSVEDSPHAHVPRSLNSDISYFGVGGKQAIFFIGNATRMLSKCEDSNDVHEMILSKDEFKQKEKNKKAIYSGSIFNRTVCDVNHIAPEDDHLRKLILEEKNEKSFTKVFITKVEVYHVAYMKGHFMNWCREIAHIYHYYLHGAHGNISSSIRSQKNIDISVSLYDKGKPAKIVHLRDIVDDMHTLYVRTAASTFDFKVIHESATVEGQLRYHPFMYDKETFPICVNDCTVAAVNECTDDDDLIHDAKAPRGDRGIFQCFWNGRLIPYTNIKNFDWCETPRRRGTLPVVCYNRISGVLWTDDAFKVSTNKLTFMDLELKLNDRSSSFTRVIAGQDQRIPIAKAFQDWLRHSHETYDKQIRFFKMVGPTKRTDLSSKKNQTSWTVFNSIEWHGNTYNKGDYVRTCRTSPIMIGSINRFILQGEYKKKEVYMTGGEVEIIQEPSALYGEKKIFPLEKLDKFFQQHEASETIAAEEYKLPLYLTIEWPEGNELKDDSLLPAGEPIGAMKVDIKNGKDESCNKIPGSQGKRLLVELKVTKASGKKKGEIVVQHTCQHGGKSWPYWFRKMETVNTLGDYVLSLNVVLADSSGPKTLKRLPYMEIKFTVTVGIPWKFTVERLESVVRSGVPFKLNINVLDYYGNTITPSKDDMKMSICANDETYSYRDISVEGKTLVVSNVLGYPKVDRIDGNDIILKVVLLKLPENSQSMKARFLPGVPVNLEVKPFENETQIQNGLSVKFWVFVKDEAGNITADPKSQVSCKITGGSKFPLYSADCSSGKGVITIPSINIKSLRKEVTLSAKLEMTNHKNVSAVLKHIVVVPGLRPADLQLFYVKEGSESPTKIILGEEVICNAGNNLSGLTFKILDEGNRVLSIDDTLASKIKVNWTTKLNKDKIIQGVLPDIKVPLSASESKFCHVACGSATEFSFTLKPQALKAHVLNCKYVEKNKVSPDQPTMSVILDVQDRYGNRLSIEDAAMVDISGEGLDKSIIKKDINKDGKLVLKDILFEDLTPGNREITFEYKELKVYQRVDVVAGPPASIKYIDFPYDQVVSMRNGHTWDGVLKVQVVDESGHSCKQSGVQICLKSEGNIKYVLPQKSSHMSQIAQNTDEKGQASFSDFSLFSSLKRGEFKIIPKASLGKYEIKATPLVVNLLADPNKAVKLVNAIPTKKVSAGDVLPEMKCCVYAEDDNIMTSVESNNITLKIWSTNNNVKANPNKTMVYCPSEPKGDDDPYHFYFRDLKAPQISGKCFISTQYNRSAKREDQIVLQSEMSYLNVFPRKAIKLVGEDQISTTTVSNSSDLKSRTLLNNFRLSLVDEFNNKCSQVEKGKIQISIENNISPTPLLNNNKSVVEYPLVKGECIIDYLVVPDGAEGKNEQQYSLLFEPTFHGEKDENIKSYVLPFLFYNDTEKQIQMSHRLKERDKLVQTINTYQVFFKTTKQLTKEMHVAVTEMSKQLLKVKSTLKDKGENVRGLDTVGNIRQRVHSLEKEITITKGKPRRKCNLLPAERHALILGKVAHLAEIENDDVARVVSWHMAGDMDCIVTINTAKAKEVYKQSNGQQQVLPLDSIYRKNVTAWEREMPHKGLSGSWKGNPVYARHLLQLIGDESHCKTIFSMLLGDTIIIDDLDSANEYRYKLVKHTYCPTILTRSGERIRSNGKFGGLGNKAPHIDRLHGNVFSAPTSRKVDEIHKTIEVLHQLEEVMENNRKAKDELESQVQEGRSEEMHLKYRECVDAEKQLKTIEKELGLTPSRRETPDPVTLLSSLSNNKQNINEDDRCEVPSERLMKTIQKEVSNSIRINNILKRKSTTASSFTSDETYSKEKRGRSERSTTNPVSSKRSTTPVSSRRSTTPVSSRRSSTPVSTRRSPNSTSSQRSTTPVSSQRSTTPLSTKRNKQRGSGNSTPSPPNAKSQRRRDSKVKEKDESSNPYKRVYNGGSPSNRKDGGDELSSQRSLRKRSAIS